jgi:hypothetical protein
MAATYERESDVNLFWWLDSLDIYAWQGSAILFNLYG